ncbi:sigma factor-like helix-turn-helix DNA-binding protein [Variovorax sp. LT1R16]|uniref:sigma-70 region 4 domain-containing protein n=1 Tax=Variovorax sp. LT1R16 TaxID=3443728 RepID=UPI003F451A18
MLSLRETRGGSVRERRGIRAGRTGRPFTRPRRHCRARSELEAVERVLQHLPRRHRSVLVALRLEDKSRQEVATWLRISLRSVDTALRQALDHCAEASGQTVMVGINTHRRGLPQR